MKLKEELAHDYAGDYGNKYLAYLEGFNNAISLVKDICLDAAEESAEMNSSSAHMASRICEFFAKKIAIIGDEDVNET